MDWLSSDAVWFLAERIFAAVLVSVKELRRLKLSANLVTF